MAGQLKGQRIGLHLALGNAPLPVQVGRVEIEQVLLNLLQNAVDSIAQSKTAGVRREITVSAAPTTDGKNVEVAVRDTGVGIAETRLGQLFEPFFTTKVTGIGMGLAICRSIVEAHGGRLWVAPGEHRRGATTLRFTIPLASKAGEPGRTQPRRAR
jgi:two-component system sensor kinase FixL